MGAMTSTPKGHRPLTRVEGLKRRIGACIQFPEASPWVRGKSADALAEALCETLRSEDVERLRVRCGVARDDNNGLRFMCKVEIAGDRIVDGPAGHAWTWWSPLVERPEELLADLRRALRQRQQRLAPSQAADGRDARADKARGPGHGTWSTELWDLGRREQGDGFCRNRRGRWTGYASAPRPLRPRQPR